MTSRTIERARGSPASWNASAYGSSLIRRLERELTRAGGAGNVRIYRLCADCYGAAQGIGELAEGVEGDPWIVV
jgi:hypothetical protein